VSHKVRAGELGTPVTLSPKIERVGITRSFDIFPTSISFVFRCLKPKRT